MFFPIVVCWIFCGDEQRAVPDVAKTADEHIIPIPSFIHWITDGVLLWSLVPDLEQNWESNISVADPVSLVV